MCSAPKPKVQPLPPARSLARVPQYIFDARRLVPPGSAASRSTVTNPTGAPGAAPTATLGGSPVVLGG